jgi:serine O-acetyltransferase
MNLGVPSHRTAHRMDCLAGGNRDSSPSQYLRAPPPKSGEVTTKLRRPRIRQWRAPPTAPDPSFARFVAPMFRNVRADLQTYGHRWGTQGLWVMFVYRFGRWRYTVRPAVLRKPLSLIYRILYKLVQIAAGVELPCEVEVGRNFVIDHFGGIIISGYAKFGDNCRIRNGVVVGLRRVDEKCAPVIGNDVDIGAGAKILGPIRIGDNVAIGANAVVLCDVPSDSIAVGIPAIVKPRRTPPSA